MRGLLITVGTLGLTIALFGCSETAAPPPGDAATTESGAAGSDRTRLAGSARTDAAAADSRVADPTAGGKFAAAADGGQAEPDSNSDTEATATHREDLSLADRQSASSDQAVDEHEAAPATDDRDEFADWPQPQLTLLISGEMHGYFEPCGCTANQLGGMARRATLFRQLQDRGWTVRGIDLGSLARRTGRQAQLKFETTLNALRAMNYTAVALGPEELRLDPGYLISQHVLDEDIPLHLLSANLVFYDTPELGTPLPQAVFEANGLKVGVTSVMGDSVRRDVLSADNQSSDIRWTPPADALPAVMQSFDEAGVTVRILLSQSSVDESRDLAKQFPEFDLVVTAEGFGEGDSEPERIGSSRLLQVGRKGRTVGVVGLYPDNAESPVRFQLVHLTEDRFADDREMIDLMRDYQDRLHDERIVLAEPPVPHPSGADFVGVDKCSECHSTAWEVWHDSRHAHAFESLDPANQRHGYERLNGISRVFDPECLSCHVTGWNPQEYFRFTGGFLNREYASTDAERTLQDLLSNNQCENCHGPGSRHVELIEAGETDQAREHVRVTLEQARDRMCGTCHDLDNSPNFQFDEYWKQIEHYESD